jgi:hypothetical protein
MGTDNILKQNSNAFAGHWSFGVVGGIEPVPNHFLP